MKQLITLLIISLSLTPFFAHAKNQCANQEKVEGILKYHLWNFGFTEYNNDCSQIAKGDFNGDGKEDYVAVLTEIEPFEKYSNGSSWYRTYIAVFLESNLPYNKYQITFIRTDGNKPKGVSVKAIQTKRGHDIAVELKGYSYTRYKWSSNGFNSSKHSAD